jgi:hypothetical protein
MKHIYAVALLFAGIALGAQTTITPSWSGVETQQLLANCQLHNSDSVVCVATDGVAFSYQGAAFVKQLHRRAQRVRKDRRCNRSNRSDGRDRTARTSGTGAEL